MNVRHFANDRLELCQLAHALKIGTDLRVAPQDFDVLWASPLRIVDNPSTVLALVKAGREIARLLAHQRLGTLLEDLDQLLLIVGFHDEDVDQGREVMFGLISIVAVIVSLLS
jgi:hypothetical protein